MMKRTRLKKIIKALFFTCVAVLLLVILINMYVCLSVKSRILNVDEAYLKEADCILVLGAGINTDGTPKNMLEDRLKVGINIFKNGKVNTILMSGDHGREDYNEVEAMKNYAVKNDIPSERIFLDHAGFSTYESVYRTKEIFGAKKVIIVTQKYHLYRSLYIAKSLGIDAYGVSADLRPYRGQPVYETREFVARIKDFLYTIIKPAPAYLGEKISFADNGNITEG